MKTSRAERALPILSEKKDGGNQENGLKGVKVSAVGQLCTAFEVSLLSSGIPGHLVCLPKPTASDKLLGEL